MVKDFRINYEVLDFDFVFDGDFDGFIFSFLLISLDKDED